MTFTDDKDSQETLTSGATAAVAAASGPLTGFTLLDASDQTVAATLSDGVTVELDDPASGSYAVRAEVQSDSDIGSVYLELSGGEERVTDRERRALLPVRGRWGKCPDRRDAAGGVLHSAGHGLLGRGWGRR